MVKSTSRSTAKPKNLAEYINLQIGLCGKKQFEIAKESGFENPNIVTMIKQGKTKVPLDKVGKLAKAIEVDPIFLFRMAMDEYYPDTMEEIKKMFGQPILSKNELDILKVIRSAKVSNPKIRTDAEKKKILDAINELKQDNETND